MTILLDKSDIFVPLNEFLGISWPNLFWDVCVHKFLKILWILWQGLKVLTIKFFKLQHLNADACGLLQSAAARIGGVS